MKYSKLSESGKSLKTKLSQVKTLYLQDFSYSLLSDFTAVKAAAVMDAFTSLRFVLKEFSGKLRLSSVTEMATFLAATFYARITYVLVSTGILLEKIYMNTLYFIRTFFYKKVEAEVNQNFKNMIKIYPVREAVKDIFIFLIYFFL